MAPRDLTDGFQATFIYALKQQIAESFLYNLIPPYQKIRKAF